MSPERAGFALADVLAATGGELLALGPSVRFPAVATDSRTVGAGDLFVALRGDTHDGHAFLGEALGRGAGAVVAETGALESRPPGGVIGVRDTLAALGDLAAWHRRRAATRVVVITGSNGKTTTKALLAAVCGAAFGDAAVLSTAGTQNNLVGLPLTLLRATGDERVAILEAGMNGPGEIWRLAEIAAPDVGVVTCVAPAHLEGLGTLRRIAEAKGELFRRLRPSATAVVNADDPLVAAAAAHHVGAAVRFGVEAGADVAAVDVDDRGLDGVRFTLRVGGRSAPVALPIPGRHNVTNALAAAAAAHVLGIGLDAVAHGLGAFDPPGMRMQVVRVQGGITVVNDAYNANPASMAAAVRTLAASRARRRIAVLGDMRELGEATAAYHGSVGRTAAEAGLDALFVLGTQAAAVRDGALAAGMPAERVVVAESHDALAASLRAFLAAGDVVLLKGSRGSAMERVLAGLEVERLR